MTNPNNKWSVNYYIHIQGSPPDIFAIKRKVAEAITALLWDHEFSKVDAFAEIFDRGLDVVIRDPANKNLMDEKQLATIQELGEIKRRREQRAGFKLIMDERGLDGFLEWAARNEIDCQEFLAEMTLPRGKTFSRRVLEELRKVFSEAQNFGAGMAIQRLVEAGVIKDIEEEKRKARGVASYYKITQGGGHGEWGWSSEAEACFE